MTNIEPFLSRAFDMAAAQEVTGAIDQICQAIRQLNYDYEYELAVLQRKIEELSKTK